MSKPQLGATLRATLLAAHIPDDMAEFVVQTINALYEKPRKGSRAMRAGYAALWTPARRATQGRLMKQRVKTWNVLQHKKARALRAAVVKAVNNTRLRKQRKATDTFAEAVRKRVLKGTK
jgi:hypothetical protein